MAHLHRVDCITHSCCQCSHLTKEGSRLDQDEWMTHCSRLDSGQQEQPSKDLLFCSGCSVKDEGLLGYTGNANGWDESLHRSLFSQLAFLHVLEPKISKVPFQYLCNHLHPSNNLFAFVNILEIVTVAKSLIAENASILSTISIELQNSFQNLVCLHFYDIVSLPHDHLYFNVYIDSSNVLPDFYLSDFQDIAYFEDFITTLVVHNSLSVIIAPFIYSRQRNVFLNRVEIMKMNNSMRSLCGVTNVEYSSDAPSRKNVGLIVGMGVAVLVMVVVVVLLYWVHKIRNVESLSNGATTNVASNFGHRIPLAAVLVATNNFDESLVVGIGGFGRVYKGTLSDGIIVAVKRGTHHLVSLIGYCNDNGEKVLIYEYMVNGTLTTHLYELGLPSLGCKERLEICPGAEKGLDYLPKHAVIHRDVKSPNILLDKNLY
ncbi:hypothetical protein LguiA_021707 [Lonicera macranthoides]